MPLLVLVSFLAFSGMATGGGDSQVEIYQPYQAFSDQSVRWPTAMIADQGELFVLDTGNHRVLVFNSTGFLRQIGRIGQEEGDLHDPSALTIDSKGRLWVVDGGNERIQVYDRKGDSKGHFAIADYTNTIAVTPKGQVLVNFPSTGAPITVISARGRRVGSIGKLPSVSDGYPDRNSAQNMGPLLGRAYLLTDDSGVYVVYQFMPLLQKYSYAGDLLWQSRLEGDSVDELGRTFWNKPGSEQAKSSRTFDGIKGNDVITASAISGDGELLVAFADGVIYVISPEGATHRILKPSSGRILGYGMSQIGRYIYMSNPIRLVRFSREGEP